MPQEAVCDITLSDKYISHEVWYALFIEYHFYHVDLGHRMEMKGDVPERFTIDIKKLLHTVSWSAINPGQMSIDTYSDVHVFDHGTVYTVVTSRGEWLPLTEKLYHRYRRAGYGESNNTTYRLLRNIDERGKLLDYELQPFEVEEEQKVSLAAFELEREPTLSHD